MVNEVCKIEGKLEEAQRHVSELQGELKDAKTKDKVEPDYERAKEYLSSIGCQYATITNMGDRALVIRDGYTFNLISLAKKIEHCRITVQADRSMLTFH